MSRIQETALDYDEQLRTFFCEGEQESINPNQPRRMRLEDLVLRVRTY
ncbi:hypothetical protein [Scytonema hofmannii]|nr:hypothetical protein [Scytonema hofmannii]